MKKHIVAFIVSLCVVGLLPISAFGATGMGDGVVLEEQSSQPATPESGTVHLYVDNTATPVLKMVDDAGTVSSLSTTSTLSLDGAYNNGVKITVDGDVIELETGASDNNSALYIDHNETTNDNTAFLIENAADAANAITIDIDAQTTGRDIEGTGASWYVTGAGAMTVASLTTTANATIGGNITVTGTFYQATIAAASSGNTNLTIDAAGTGTITLGGTSTGKITTDNLVELYGNADIGNAATDTLTITSIIDGNVTLDDGTTDSPSLILKDATDETATFTKADGGNVTVTPGGATESLQVLTGNFAVGNGSPGTAAMDGEDAYVEGQLEVDGAVQLDGALTCASTVSLNANTTFTAGAAEYIQLDAATTDSTTTAGVLDINHDSVTNGSEGINVKTTFVAGGGGSEYVSGIVVDLDDDSDAAGTLSGIRIDSSDATGSSVIVGLAFESAAGADTAVEDCIVAQLPAAGQFAVIDAAGTDNTATAGVIDLDYDTVTDAAEAINIDLAVGDAAGAVTVTGILVDLDDDTSTAAGTIRGFSATSSDLTGHANTTVTGFYSSGCDVAAQFDNGYLRVGTGSSPGVTPGDDDVYVEGTVEVDGVLYPDGGINAGGTGAVIGLKNTATVSAGATVAVTAAMTGTVFFNDQATEFDLPADPTGLEFTFCVDNASNLVIDPNGTDRIWGATDGNGDSLTSSTVGDTITLVGTAADTWFVKAIYPTSTDWADTN